MQAPTPSPFPIAPVQKSSNPLPFIVPQESATSASPISLATTSNSQASPFSFLHNQPGKTTAISGGGLSTIGETDQDRLETATAFVSEGFASSNVNVFLLPPRWRLLCLGCSVVGTA
ncbi:hypothetical protein AAHE18_08G052800 [Arachis hypogaea]|nr:uncharacterized protein LOC112706098 [Arachis hypogaea]QHO29979.1 uncharacterized protein DS421_8g229470 [Arachis hypogaea]